MKQGLKPLVEKYQMPIETIDERIDNHKKPLSKRMYEKLGYNVIAVLTKMSTMKPYHPKLWYYGMNIVTTDGNEAYAEKSAGETVTSTLDFWGASGRMQVANPVSQNTPAASDNWDEFDNPIGKAISGSNLAFESGYPKTNDGDADNTGAGVTVVSWLKNYTKTDFNDGGTTIKNTAIHVGGASPVTTTNLLAHSSITAFNKTADDTLKLFYNHTMLGV